LEKWRSRGGLRVEKIEDEIEEVEVE